MIVVDSLQKLMHLEEDYILSNLPIDSNNGTFEDAVVNEVASDYHHKIIQCLFHQYIVAKANNLFVVDYDDVFDLCDLLYNDFNYTGDIEFIPHLCEQFHVIYLNSKFKCKEWKVTRGKSKANLIELGAVYTQPSIALDIVKDTLSSCKKIDDNFSILDFACGTGRFYDAIIQELESYGITPAQGILNNIYALDIDKAAIDIIRMKALSYFDQIDLDIAKAVCSHILVRNALIKNDSYFDDEAVLHDEDLDGKTAAGFDAIVSNPPYLVLKPNKKKMDSESGRRLMDLVDYFRKSGNYSYSIEGMLNLYQLSIESMLSMLKTGGGMGIICPSTLFADISATKLRKHLLLSNRISSISFFGEDAQLFENVSQATCIFILNKCSETKEISIQSNGKSFLVNLNQVEDLFPDNYEIPIISEGEWLVLSKLNQFQKLREISSIRNRRGELDLTLCAKYITKEPTRYRLIRGNMITPDGIRDCNNEFVIEDFVATRSSEFISNDFNKRRLICQQISNANTKKRLKFIFCEENDILGNSCNYISSDEITLRKMYLVLNSNILNWRFKVTSSNNHINNYELAELPIVDLDKVNPDFAYTTQEELDSYIGGLYGLTENEIKLITT